MPSRSAAILLLVASVAGAAPASAMPDLVPEIASLSVAQSASVDPGDVAEGCAGAETGRHLVRFGTRVRNEGSSDLVLGAPGCPDCATNPGAACTNPLFECSESHGHPHFHGFIRAELLDAGGAVAATGHKHGFCLLDLECATPVYTCGNQGISAGCADVYVEGLPCQYIDITDQGLPQGLYTLRVTVDADEQLAEADEGNNVVTRPVALGSPPPTCPVHVATGGLPAAIPDLGLVSTTVAVPSGTVDRIRIVDLAGTHGYMQDLEFRLRSPSGTEVVAVDRVCGGSAGFDLDVSDAASEPIPCPPADGNLYLPSHPLAPFGGEESGGVWTLEVRDLAASDAGTLDGWGLEVCDRCGNGVLDAGEACDDGNTAGGDCCASDCQSAAPDGTACGDAAACLAGGLCASGSCAGAVVSCDPCLECDPPNGCVEPEALLCSGLAPDASKLTVRKHPISADRDRLAWTWKAGAPVAMLDFGAPETVTDLTFCLFDDDGLQLSATAPAAGLCGLGPCWRRTPSLLRYRDKELSPDGLLKLKLKPGDAGKGTVQLKGRGADLGAPTLPLRGTVTARLVRGDGTPCWEATYADPKRNDEKIFRARSPQ